MKAWWTNGGSNPDLRGANAACSRYHYQPIDYKLASREGLEPPRTVLETVMLPLHHRDISYLRTEINACSKADCTDISNGLCGTTNLLDYARFLHILVIA